MRKVTISQALLRISTAALRRYQELNQGYYVPAVNKQGLDLALYVRRRKVSIKVVIWLRTLS